MPHVTHIHPHMYTRRCGLRPVLVCLVFCYRFVRVDSMARQLVGFASPLPATQQDTLFGTVLPPPPPPSSSVSWSVTVVLSVLDGGVGVLGGMAEPGRLVLSAEAFRILWPWPDRCPVTNTLNTPTGKS